MFSVFIIRGRVLSQKRSLIYLCISLREKVQEEGLEESKSERKSKHKTESEYKKTVTNTDASIQAG